MRSGWWLVGVGISAILFAGGCGDAESSGGSESGQVKPAAGVIVGKVTGQDGKPIDPSFEITVNINGVSTAGEKVGYSPAVKPDGTYSQKVAPGQYRFGRSFVKAKFNGQTFDVQLVPVGNLAYKDRDSAEPITQDFVWKTAGQVPDTDGNPNNHTQWYGMTIGMRFQTWRSDINKAPSVPPEGTKLLFVLTPKSKTIDGRELQPVTIERAWRPKDLTPNDNLHDLPPADYQITGAAQLPDGTTKPLLLQGKNDYPAYKATVDAKLENGGFVSTYFICPVGWVME